MVLMLTKVYLLSNGLWPSLMAITREHEGSLESSTVIQDVRTRIPKDPRLPGVPSPSVLQQCSDPKLNLPGGLTCTHSPVRWTSTSGTSATIVEAQLVVAMDWYGWQGCRCECKNLHPAPPTVLVFKLRPHFFHCSPFVPVQVALFSANPRSTGPVECEAPPVQPPQWPTIAHCLPPLYPQDLHYLLQPSPLLAHYEYGSEVIYIILWSWAEFRNVSSISQRHGQKNQQKEPENPGFHENW